MKPASSDRVGARQSQNVVLITAGDPRRLTGGNLYNRYVLEALECAGWSVRRVVLPDRAILDALATLGAALVEQKTALVIVDSISLVPAALQVPGMCRALRARTLALMHMLPSELTPKWKRPIIRYLERRLLSTADAIVAVGPGQLRPLVAAGAAAERVTVITPGRDGAGIPPNESAGRRGHGFLCVANWTPNKGVHRVVEALARLDTRECLDLVGEEVEPTYAHRLHDLIDRHRLRDRVHIHGPLHGDSLGKRYAEADVFVLPSASEGFGTVYAEAMSFGLPVIACRVGSIPRLVEEGCGILIPPGDDDALRLAMGTLAADADLRQRMGTAAALRSQRLPTWQESCQRFCQLVSDLLER